MSQYLIHNSDDPIELCEHMQRFLAREFRGRVAKTQNPRLLTMTRGSNIPGGQNGSGPSGGGGGGGGAGSVILYGDCTGPSNNTVNVQASGTFGIGGAVLAGTQASIVTKSPSNSSLIIQSAVNQSATNLVIKMASGQTNDALDVLAPNGSVMFGISPPGFTNAVMFFASQSAGDPGAEIIGYINQSQPVLFIIGSTDVSRNSLNETDFNPNGSTAWFQAVTGNSTVVPTFAIVPTAADPTAATYKGRAVLGCYDFNTPGFSTYPAGAPRESIRMEADGTNPRLGFLGAAAIARPASYTLAGTATRTFPADPSASYSGINNAQAGSVYAQVSDLNTLRGVVSSLLGVVRQLQQDLGTASGFGLLSP